MIICTLQYSSMAGWGRPHLVRWFSQLLYKPWFSSVIYQLALFDYEGVANISSVYNLCMEESCTSEHIPRRAGLWYCYCPLCNCDAYPSSYGSAIAPPMTGMIILIWPIEETPLLGSISKIVITKCDFTWSRLRKPNTIHQTFHTPLAAHFPCQEKIVRLWAKHHVEDVASKHQWIYRIFDSTDFFKSDIEVSWTSWCQCSMGWRTGPPFETTESISSRPCTVYHPQFEKKWLGL